MTAFLRETLVFWEEFTRQFLTTLQFCLRGPWRWKETTQAIVQIGVESVPIIAIATAFAGLVVTHEIAWHMDQALHTTQMIPGFSGQFIVRELGIAIPALLMVAKAGAAMTAEVGNMKITEQIDALRLLGIHPTGYIVFPKFVASIFSLVCLTILAISVTLVCAMGVAVFQHGFGLGEYFLGLRHSLDTWDLLCAIAKSAVFGAVIPIVSCTYGFRCKGGAEGVGSATTNSVVTSTILVIALDFLLTWVFTQFV